MVHVVVTGGAGFLGARLARELLAAGTLGVAGDEPRPLSRLTLIDQAPIAADLAADDRVTGVRADLAGLLAHGAHGAHGADGDPGNPLAGADVIFHLAAAVSAECEADFDLGMRANVAATQALLAACRALGTRPVVVYASSLAVFGGSAQHPLPAVVDDQTAPNPQTSYGTHKLIGEHLLADYTRKGFLRGRAMRLMTVCVRPGRPNAAASGFMSSIIREPMAGQRATCPVPPATEVALASPAKAITALLRAATSTGQAWGDHTAVTMPALTVTVAEMAAALERVAGRQSAALIDWIPDPAIAAIVTGWPARVRAERAARLGLTPDADFESIVRMHAAQFGIKRFLSGTKGGICIRPCLTRLTIVHSVTDPKVREFLLAGTRTGKLSYTAADGRPLVVPVWFVLREDRLVFNTGKDTAKGRALARDPRVALCVDLEEPPFAFVQVQGVAELSQDPADLVATATAIGARYMGRERAEEFGRRNGVPGELVVRIRPTKVIAVFDITGPQGEAP